MRITEVEAIVLRQPSVDAGIADGSQDDLVVRVHTDEGIVGIGEVDSAPEVVKAVIDAPASHAIASGLRHVLIGEDPLAARAAAGDSVDILNDARLGYGDDAQTAIRVARELEQLGIFWLEEPFMPDELGAYAELADTVDIRIAGGEEEATRWGFLELIERGHVDVVQPDVKSGIVKAASLHLNAVLPDALFQGYCAAETPINTYLTRQKLPLKDGYVAVPMAPGLGIELEPEVLERRAWPSARGRCRSARSPACQ